MLRAKQPPHLSLSHTNTPLSPPPCPAEQLLAECAPKGAHTEPAPKVNRAGETRGRCRYCCWRWLRVFSAWQVPASRLSLSVTRLQALREPPPAFRGLLTVGRYPKPLPFFPPREEVEGEKKKKRGASPGLYGISSLPSPLRRFPAFFFLLSSASGGTGTLLPPPPPSLPQDQAARRWRERSEGVRGGGGSAGGNWPGFASGLPPSALRSHLPADHVPPPPL